MAEQHIKEEYIKCSRCKCKYINDDEHIKIDFGYTRLGKQFKTCNKCRDIRGITNKKYIEQNLDKYKEYGKI